MSGFRAHIEMLEAEPAGDGCLRVRVAVRNTSDRTWPAAGPVALAHQVLDEAGASLLLEGDRVPFGEDLPPGERREISFTVLLPDDDGAYRVLVSAVEDPVAWFHERGSACLMLDVRTEAGKAGVLRQQVVTATRRFFSRGRSLVLNLVRRPLSGIWRHRSLIASMVRRDVQGRYRGSVGGVFWTVIHPLLLMLAYFFVFSVVLQVRFGTGPESAYPVNFLLYFICGMLPWLAFSEALARAPSLLLEHRTLVTRVLFPLEILPVNIAFSALASGFFALVVFLTILLYLRHGVPPTALYLPAIILPQLLLTIGLCWFLAALGVFLRDTGQFMSFLLTLWFFATPICYPESALPARALWLFEKNPLYVLARAYRAVFLEHAAPDIAPLAWLAGVSVVIFLAGFAWFHKSRKSFADIL